MNTYPHRWHERGICFSSFSLTSYHSCFLGAVEHVFAISKDTEYAQKSFVECLVRIAKKEACTILEDTTRTDNTNDRFCSVGSWKMEHFCYVYKVELKTGNKEIVNGTLLYMYPGIKCFTLWTRGNYLWKRAVCNGSCPFAGHHGSVVNNS